jgi:hypothetical protein
MSVTLSAHPRDTTSRPEGSAAATPVLYLTLSASMAVRNFFQTAVLDLLAEHFEIEVLASPATAPALQSLKGQRKLRITVIDPGEEPHLWKWLRQAKKKVYMEGRRSATEAIWEKYTRRPLYQRIGGVFFRGLTRFISAEWLYQRLEALDLSLNRNRDLVRKFQRHPAMLFATHATTYFEEYIYRNARAAGIPKMYMILSWDHLSSKVLLHQDFDRILAWNSHTKAELLQTYKSYSDDSIRVVGIPQFDAYRRLPEISYSQWCAQYGLDPAKRTILFSTMPQQRHEQQHIILEALLKAILDGKDVPSDLQVLVKCHPFDTFAGYDSLLGRYPVAVLRSSLLPGQTFDEWLPKEQEIEISKDCLYFCCININIFSTVTIEASVFDKPIIHIAYDPLPISNRIPCHEYYNWEHFRHIVQKGASTLVHSHQELLVAIRKYCSEPDFRRSQRRLLVETYIGQPIGLASATVVEELIEFKRLFFLHS